jgi:GNAT superfamily N-acetyltransferase
MKFNIYKVDCRKPEIVSILVHLQKLCLPSDAIYDVSRGHWWVAYTENDKPIGFAGLVRSNAWVDCGYLCRAGVVPSHRGKGLQKRLIKVREAQAKRLNWNWLITDTYLNPASSNSLISCGFRLYEPSEPWSFPHALYFRKNISAVQEKRSSISLPKKALSK